MSALDSTAFFAEPEFGLIDPRALPKIYAREERQSQIRITEVTSPEFHVDPLPSKAKKRMGSQVASAARQQIQNAFARWQQMRDSIRSQLLKMWVREKKSADQPTAAIVVRESAPSGFPVVIPTSTKPRKIWSWARRVVSAHQSRKRLRLCESISLGEKRFIAIVQVDGEQFLVGGAADSLNVLARLEQSSIFPGMVRQRLEQNITAI